MPVSEAKENTAHDLARRYRENHGADVVLYNSRVNSNGFIRLAWACLNTERRARDVVLFLSTYGGDPESAYRIARFLQDTYDNFTVVVPDKCKSAGTIIAIGAHRIVMFPLGELGPLDVQVIKQDELFELSSGASVVSALEVLKDKSYEVFEAFMERIKDSTAGAVTLRTSSDVAASMTVGLFKEIFRQIDPHYLGEMNRNMRVAYEYGRRLAESSKNIENSNIHKLIYDYPAHNFVIDKREADDLFHNVASPDGELKAIYQSLGQRFFEPSFTGDIELLSVDTSAPPGNADEEAIGSSNATG